MIDQIDPVSFVEAVRPALASKDLQRLLQTCKSQWTAAQIISLLSSKCCDARKCAALALSLVGCPACLEPRSFRRLGRHGPLSCPRRPRLPGGEVLQASASDQSASEWSKRGADGTRALPGRPRRELTVYSLPL